LFGQLGDLANECVERAVPMVSLAALLSTAWAGLACYSALTIVTVSGRMGVRALTRADPGVAFLTLPLLPLALIGCRAISATDLAAAIALDMNGGAGAGPRRLRDQDDDDDDDDDGGGDDDDEDEDDLGGGGEDDDEEDDDELLAIRIGEDPLSFSRIAVGGLLFPYAASGVGWMCFGRVRESERLLRTVFGGLL